MLEDMPFGIGAASEQGQPVVSASEDTAPRASAWASLWQSLTRFQREKIIPWIALRNAIGFVVPLALGMVLGNVPAGIAMATGAMNVSYSDSDDP